MKEYGTGLKFLLPGVFIILFAAPSLFLRATAPIQGPGNTLVLHGSVERPAGFHHLDWVLPDEGTVNFIEVEFSTDGKQYQTAGIVFIMPHQDNKYVFRQPLARDRTLTFYRLKQVNNNGTVAYSNTIRLGR